MTDTVKRAWYDEVRPDDHGAEWQAVCREMQQMAADVAAWEEAAWESFSRYIHDTALDQEVYGEAICADPGLLDPMWSAFRAAWDARDGS